MASSSDLSARERITAALVAILERARTPILVVLGIGVAFIIAYAIYSQVSNDRAQKATMAAESIQRAYSNWQNETDTTKKAAIKKSIVAQTDSVMKEYPNGYGTQRALFVRGDIAFEAKQWKAAETFYERLADRFPDSYLTPVSLANAAAASEEQGNVKHSIELNKRIVEMKGMVPEIPHALFAIGRLSETGGDTKDAETSYNKLINGYPSSGWTNLARDRIIYLAVHATAGTSAIKKGEVKSATSPPVPAGS